MRRRFSPRGYAKKFFRPNVIFLSTFGREAGGFKALACDKRIGNQVRPDLPDRYNLIDHFNLDAKSDLKYCAPLDPGRA